MVAARTQTWVDAMNAQLEVFYAYQVVVNQQLAYNSQVTEPLPIFPPPPLPHGDDWDIEGNINFKFGERALEAWRLLWKMTFLSLSR